MKQGRSIKLNTLLGYYEKELAEELIKEQYHQKVLNELLIYSRVLSNTITNSSEHNHLSRILQEGRNDDDINILLSESHLNLSLQSEKISPTRSKKGPLTCDMEYEQCCKQIAKLSAQLAQRENANITIKKTSFLCPPTTPKRNSSMIMRPKSSRNIDVKAESSHQIQSLKTDRDMKDSAAKEILLQQIGNNCILGSNDEVVNVLVKNLRAQEERYVDGVWAGSAIGLRTKMKNYMERVSEKNEELCFKLKQEAVDRQLTKIEGNKETVKRGYTLRMQKLVERGLGHSAGRLY